MGFSPTNPVSVQSIPLRIVAPPPSHNTPANIAEIPPATFVQNAGARGLAANAFIRHTQPAQQRNLQANTAGTTGNPPAIVGAPGSVGTPGGQTSLLSLSPVRTTTSITAPPKYTTGNSMYPGRRKPATWKTIAIAGGVALVVALVVAS